MSEPPKARADTQNELLLRTDPGDVKSLRSLQNEAAPSPGLWEQVVHSLLYGPPESGFSFLLSLSPKFTGHFGNISSYQTEGQNFLLMIKPLNTSSKD